MFRGDFNKFKDEIKKDLKETTNDLQEQIDKNEAEFNEF